MDAVAGAGGAFCAGQDLALACDVGVFADGAVLGTAFTGIGPVFEGH